MKFVTLRGYMNDNLLCTVKCYLVNNYFATNVLSIVEATWYRKLVQTSEYLEVRITLLIV
jgi:hypothetical protein